MGPSATTVPALVLPVVREETVAPTEAALDTGAAPEAERQSHEPEAPVSSSGRGTWDAAPEDSGWTVAGSTSFLVWPDATGGDAPQPKPQLSVAAAKPASSDFHAGMAPTAMVAWPAGERGEAATIASAFSSEVFERDSSHRCASPPGAPAEADAGANGAALDEQQGGGAALSDTLFSGLRRLQLGGTSLLQSFGLSKGAAGATAVADATDGGQGGTRSVRGVDLFDRGASAPLSVPIGRAPPHRSEAPRADPQRTPLLALPLGSRPGAAAGGPPRRKLPPPPPLHTSALAHSSLAGGAPTDRTAGTYTDRYTDRTSDRTTSRTLESFARAMGSRERGASNGFDDLGGMAPPSAVLEEPPEADGSASPTASTLADAAAPVPPPLPPPPDGAPAAAALATQPPSASSVAPAEAAAPAQAARCGGVSFAPAAPAAAAAKKPPRAPTVPDAPAFGARDTLASRLRLADAVIEELKLGHVLTSQAQWDAVRTAAANEKASLAAAAPPPRQKKQPPPPSSRPPSPSKLTSARRTASPPAAGTAADAGSAAPVVPTARARATPSSSASSAAGGAAKQPMAARSPSPGGAARRAGASLPTRPPPGVSAKPASDAASPTANDPTDQPPSLLERLALWTKASWPFENKEVPPPAATGAPKKAARPVKKAPAEPTKPCVKASLTRPTASSLAAARTGEKEAPPKQPTKEPPKQPPRPQSARGELRLAVVEGKLVPIEYVGRPQSARRAPRAASPAQPRLYERDPYQKSVAAQAAATWHARLEETLARLLEATADRGGDLPQMAQLLGRADDRMLGTLARAYAARRREPLERAVGRLEDTPARATLLGLLRSAEARARAEHESGEGDVEARRARARSLAASLHDAAAKNDPRLFSRAVAEVFGGCDLAQTHELRAAYQQAYGSSAEATLHAQLRGSNAQHAALKDLVLARLASSSRPALRAATPEPPGGPSRPAKPTPVAVLAGLHTAVMEQSDAAAPSISELLSEWRDLQEAEKATADVAAETRPPHAQRPDTRATEGFSSAAGAEEAWRTRLQRRQRDMGMEERRELAATTMQTHVRGHLAKKLFGHQAMIIALLKARLLRWVRRVRRRKAAERRARDAKRAAANAVVARLTPKPASKHADATPVSEEPPGARSGSASHRQRGGGAAATSRVRPSSPQRATIPAPAQPRSRSSQRDASTTLRSQRSSAQQDGAAGGGGSGGAGDAAAGNGRAAPLDEAAARELSAARRRQVKDILGVESAESWWADRSQSELGRVTKPPVS